VTWFHETGLIRSETVELKSPLSRNECVQRLRRELNAPWKIFGDGPVMGTVSEASLRARKRIWYGNSFQTILSAVMSDDGTRTHIACKFGLSCFVRVFSIFWLAGVLSVGGMLFLASLASLVSDPTQAMKGTAWVGLVVPPAMILFFFVGLGFGRYLARDERDCLLQYLNATIAAQRIYSE
jgi:hypothetical protein